jgi:hypothetical protein
MKLIERVKGMILSPAAEWQSVAVEAASVKELYVGYNVPLSAIGPVATFLGLTIFGLGIPFVGALRLSMTAALSQMIVSYIFGLVAVFLVALLIDFLAPKFGGESNPVQALKVAGYSSTPAWVAGILNLLPALSMLVLVASIYSIYVLYLGLQVVMKAPKEKALGYSAAVIIISIVLGVVASAVVGRIGMGVL